MKGIPARHLAGLCVRHPDPEKPSPKSQPFSRSYGSILPTSLIYITLLA